MTCDRSLETATIRDSIAIVGIGCRLPGNISNVDELFAALCEGRDCVSEIPPDRWNVDDYYDPDPLTPGKSYVRWGGFVNDIDRFDAGFFGISDAEAARMDPQQRMLLETVWHALEHAGQTAEELQRSNTGVFLAMMNTNDYCQLKGAFEGLPGVTGYDAMGDAISITAGRISHFLDLEGPCIALDTACSGSVVALHLARQHILAGDCDAAIVAGVSAILHPGISVAFSKVGLMSYSGRCRTFDEAADGYVRSEGCMALFLRRQSVAMERGDRILATVVSTAINQDGRTPALTAPNPQAQEKVMRTALERVGVRPSGVGYIEAHGTGTPVGDPIELMAITNVYGSGRSEQERLFVGSVKSNFGHMEAASGLLSVAKVALSLQREVIFPSIHFNKLNSSIKLGDAPVSVPTTTIPWPRRDSPRFAGVNSFGYSGTNAHAILQEPPVQTGRVQATDGPVDIIVLSAKSAGSLEELTDKWVDLLAQDTMTVSSDMAFTAAVGRTHFRHRLAVVGTGKADIADKLGAWREGRKPNGLFTGNATGRRGPKIAFMFTGQGAQYAGMGRQLYDEEPRFRASIDRCATVMDSDFGVSLHEALFGSASAELLTNTRYVQPALFAIEYALSDLLGYWGIQPDFVIGHSVGEMAAACVAGVLDLEQAARFIITRARLMGELPKAGKMLAIEAPLEEVSEWILGKESEVSIAAVNGPHSLVLSGRAAVIEAIAEKASAVNRRSKLLATSHAFHSPLMDPVMADLGAAASSLHTSSARVPIVSNVTGEYLASDVNGQYWSDQMRQPVLFHKGIRRIVEAGGSVLVEIGPHPALIPAVSSGFDLSKLICVPTLKRDRLDVSHMMEAIASLFVTGVPVNLGLLFEKKSGRRVTLPLYPFRRDRYWLWNERPPDPALHKGELPRIRTGLHPLLGQAVTVAPRRVVFETTLNATSPWVDHRVLGSTVFPGSAYLEMAARGFAAVTGDDWRSVMLRDVVFERPLVLRYGKFRKLSLTLNNLQSNGTSSGTFVIAAADSGTENYCRGRIGPASEIVEQVAFEALFGQNESKLDIGPFYGELRKQGLEYGSSFSTIRQLWAGKPDSGEALARIQASAFEEEPSPHPFTNTSLLDGCLQVFAAALSTFQNHGQHGAFVPASLQSFTIKRPLPHRMWSHVKLSRNKNGVAAVASVRVLNDSGEVLADIEGLELRQKSTLTPDIKESTNGKSTTSRAPASESRSQLIGRLQTSSKEKRVGILVGWLASEVKDIMGHAAEEIDIDRLDPSTAFLEIGLDSLLVTELQRRVQEKLEFRFQPMQALDYQSIESLAHYILAEVLKLEQSQLAAKAVGSTAL